MDDLYRILYKIINMGITGTIAIAVVLVVRMMLCKAPRKYSYMLWGIVLFRLLCPVSLPAGFSVLNVTHVEVTGKGEVNYIPRSLPKGRGYPDLKMEQRLPIWDLPGREERAESEKEAGMGFSGTSIGEAANGPMDLPIEPEGLSFMGEPSAIWFVAWLAGAGILAGSRLVSGMRLYWKVSSSMKVRGNIYLSDYIASPFALGVFRPKIYLPSNIGEQERAYIILHEQYHISRKDHLIRIAAFLAVCLHWFNPFVWLAFYLSGNDMEMSCDEAVMQDIDVDIRAEYAESLLRFTIGARKPEGMPLAFGEGNVKKRIKNIMNYKKPATVISIAGITCCLISGVALMTNPKPEGAMQKIAGLGNSDPVFEDGRYPGNNGGGATSSQEMEEVEENAIKDAVIEHNGEFYSGVYGYDFACCSFVELGKEALEPEKGEERRKTTYYGWALYGEYIFGEGGLEEVGGSYMPVALTFTIDGDGFILEGYWEPRDGSYFEEDVRGKFPEYIVEDGLNSQKFVVRQTQNCYAQAVAYGEMDTDPVIEKLLKEVCSDAQLESSDPQDYIDAHMGKYRELTYYGGYTIRYCLERFEKGGETGLEGHIMARVCEEIVGAAAEIPVKARLSETGQQWYDDMKGFVGNILEKFIETEEIPPHIDLGIPVSLPQNKNWIQNLTVKESDENYLQLQYYDGILGGGCRMWVVKDGEINLPALEFEENMDETWEGHTIAERLIIVKVRHAEGWALAAWEYDNYKFAILGEVPTGQSDTNSIPKTALGIIMSLP